MSIVREYGPSVASEVASENAAQAVADPAVTSMSSVALSQTSVQLLPSDADRKGATIFNASSVILYILCGSGDAGPTNFTDRISQDDSWPVPFGYTGRIAGMWAGPDPSGVAMITRFS